MGYSDFVAKLRPDLFDAYGDDQQDPVKLPDIQNPSLPPVQIAPTQQNIPAPEIDPHQAAIESIFGKARPNFGIALPETNLKPATNDYQPPKVKARVGSVSSAKVPKQTGTIEGSVEAKNPYTGGSTNPTLPNELGGNFKTYDDLMNWKPSSGFQSGAPLAQYVDLQRRLKDLPRPDRDFKTLDEFNQWYREAQQGQNAQNQPQRQQQQSSQSVRNRAAEAARAMKHLEYTKQQALDLFDQANNTQNVGADSELRQRAEYQLEAANELGRKYAKSYGDLLEIGFGSDPNSTYPNGQPRQWVYVKPKDSQVTYESTRQDLQSGQRRKGRQADAYKQQQIDRLEGVDTGQTYIDPKAEQDARDIQGQGVLHGAFNRFAGAAIRGATAIPEGFARIGDTIAGYAGEAELAMDPEFQKMSPEQQAEIRRRVAQQDPSLGDRLEGVSKFGSNLADTVVPIDKSRKGSINPLTGEFWEVTMPEVAGLMVPFMASSAIGGALGLPSRLIAGGVGAAMEVPEQYAEARDAGGTPEQMRRATLTGMGAGALEAVGAESLMGKLGFHGKSPVGHLAHEAIHEGLQEGPQQFVENVGAKYFSKHDPNRSLSKDVLENAVPALFLGAGGAAMGMPGHLREQRAEVDQVAAERQSSPEFTPSAPEGTQTQVIKLRTVAQQIKDLADASPEHPVVQTVKQLGIDPVTIPQANDQAIEALSEGLKTIAETHTQFAELEQQKGTADQQLQNVQDQLRMGRVPTDAEQQQAQQGQVVAQQIEQNIQQQQAVIDDLVQNVSPLFKNLAKAIGAKEKSIEPIGDAADDATKSLVSEVRKVGGISASEGTVEKGELDRLSPKESGTTGLIRREGGTSADQMREQMASEGLTKAETAHEFIQEVEDELKRPKKAESESFDDYQRGKLSDTEAFDSDLLDTLSKDRAHPFTRVYRALDNTKTVYTPRLAKDFVREADKAGFSGDFIENALVDFQNRRGMLLKEEAEVTPKPQASNRTVTQYRQMVDSNKPAIDRLHSLNLNSEEAKGLIAGIQQFNKREGISPHHLGNLLDGIKDWQAHHPPKGLEGRGTPKQPQISATRNSETPNAQPARSEPTPKLSLRGAFTLEQRKLLGTDHTNLMDVEFDDYLKSLEEMQGQAVRNSEHGGIATNNSEYNAVVGKIIEVKAERHKRVLAKRLPSLSEPREKPRKLSKKELGIAMVAAAKAKREAAERGQSEKQDTDLQSSKSLENQQVEATQPDKAEKGDTILRAVDEAAHEAATSPKNNLPEPTEAQIDKHLEAKEAKSDERSSDSTRSDENKPRDDGGSGAIESPGDAGTIPKPEKAGTKPRGSVSKRGGRGTTRGSQPTAPSLFGDNAVQSSDQSDSQQTATKAELIADVEAQTQELSSGEAVIQAAVADLPPEPEPENEPESPVAEIVRPAKPKPEPLGRLTAASMTITPEIAKRIQSGGQMTKYKQNIAAIHTMRQILQEGRRPTVDEQETMAMYAGFGGIKPIFYPYDYSLGIENRDRQKWAKAQDELRELIGDKAYDAARDSTKNAHFTDPHIVQSMWQVAKHLGFTGGRMLEPSVGIGNFIGLMPEDLRGTTSVTGVELDLTTGEMARMLYPDANIKIQGFEKLNAPDGFYDLAIGNVPFGDYTVSDSRYNKFSANIHNYFFLKAMDKVRPGGLVMFITSTGTMDAARAKIVRKALAEQADLVTAIRFPAETFAKTALTSVVTDLVILRKRLPGEEPKDKTWVESERVENPDGGKPIWLNTWLDKNRQNMLGEFNGRNRMYPNRANVDRTDDFEDRFRAVIDNLPQGIMSAAVSSKTALKEAGANVKTGGYVIDNGRLMANVRNKGLVEIEATPDRIRRVIGLLGIRDVFNKLSDAELGRSSDSPEKLRRDLNSAYDAFIARHGIINDKKNLTALADDPDLPRLQALENYDSKTKTAKKMPVFTKSTVVGSLSKSKPTTIVEGVVKSFSQTGKIDPAMIAEDLGLDLDTVGSELVERGIAYHTPQGQWELAAHYLSGNVRRKLAEARLAVATNQEFQPNVDALERVVPRDVPHTNIAVEMGAPWMEPKVIADFVGDLFKDNSDNTKVFYDRNLGTYTVNYLSGSRAKGSMEATSTWGTPRVPFDELLSLALAGKSPRVVDWVKDADGTRREVFLPAQTQQAQTKMDAIKQRFKEWVWQDEERKNALTTRYNEQFNSMVPSRYDVSFMLDKPEKGKPRGGSIPGMNPDWKLRPHQLAGVFRAIIEQRGLFAHEVGLGKTLTMIASASELKRLGIAKKPAIAVPKKVLPGFAATAREVFPLLKLHVIDAEDAASRNRTMSQVATGDHDLVLMTHDNMDMLKMRPEFEAEMLQKELDEVDAVYYAMAAENRKATKSSAEGKIMAQILKRREKLAAKIKTALESERKDDTITFEDTGIDFLMVDEFHKYKSLPVITALGQVKGVPTNDSQRATNMFMRVRYLQSIQRGGGIIGATGTPISNSLVEAYIVSKYLQPDLLEEAGVQSFDAWVRNFASVVSALEMGATQEWKVVSRLSEFKNLPELKMLSRMTLDVQTAEKTGILEKRPKRIDTVADVKQSPTQQVYMKVLKERADRIKGGHVDKSIDNYLVLSTDGMMMALDPRLVLPDWKEEGSKLLALTDNVMRIHKAKPDMAQMIFCDVGVGATAWGFRYYDAVIDKLVSAGIPREKIIDFSKLNTDKKVETAVARLNSGDALVAIGHRENMGTGVNAQDRMAAIHQLDPPWKPSAIEQSEARGWREGNLNEEVEIIPYVGSGSFDAVKWATVSRKHQGIRSFMADEVGTDRTLEETDDDALSYDQIAAVASGDGDYLRKAELDAKVFKLENMQRAHESDRLNREHQMNALPMYIKEAERKIVELDQVSDAAAEIQEKPFSYITVKGEVIEDKKEAAKILSSEFLFTKDKKEKVNLGYYKGAKLVGDGYGWTRIEIKPKGSYETKEYNFNVNTTEFIGTIQSLERTVAGLADRGNQEYLRNTKIPMLKKDIEELAKVATAPFPFDEQLAKAKKQLDAVKKRLAAKESANAAEGEPLVAKGLDVRAVASLGRDVRRGLREKEMTPADVRRIIDQRMPEIEASTKDAVEMWQMVQRRKAEEFLESMDNDTGLAGMAITAASARREQALYDPELDSTPPASLRQPTAQELNREDRAIDTLLYQGAIVKTRGSRGSRMYVNDHSRALLGVALTQLFDRDYTNINAINLSREEVYRIASYIDKETSQSAISLEHKKGALYFSNALRQMVDDSKGQRTFNIVDITPFAERHEGEVRSDVDKAVEQFKGTIREESFHWSQRQVNGQSIALVGSSWAQSSKGYAKYRKALVERYDADGNNIGYPDDPETIAAEAAAKIAAGLYDELGIRSEADHQQAAAWLASYFDRVAEKHGLDALDKFDRLLQPAKAAKEKGATSARERLAERIKQDKERATVASNRPRAPGGGGETVQKNEASQSERRQEPVRKADIDAPFEGGKIKGPQLPLSEQVNAQNVRLAGEEKPSVGGAGFGGKPPKGPRPLFNEEPAEPPKPWEREPKQRSFGEEEPSFDKVGNPTGRWKKFFENLSDVINIPKALRATFDLSATLRQAFYMAAPHPILGIKSFGRQIKSLKQVNYDQFYKWLKSHPAYKDAKAAGLEFSGDNPLNVNEENFGTRFAGKIPGVAMAERAFVTMLDSMRIEVFDLYRKTANKQFKDPRERFESHEAAASWINKTSGRADFGKGKYGNFMRNAAIPFLNVFGWSPRFVYSRFQMLNPWTYAQNLKNAPRRAVFVRQVAEIFQTAATLVATGALATAAGGNISLDEDDPDFLKIRFGTTRYDVLAGVQQAARLAIKIGKWIESRGMEDDEKKLKKISRDTAAAIPRFARTKLAPVPGFFTDWINDWVKVTGEVHRPGEFWGMAKEGDYSGAAAEFVNDPVLSLAMPMMFSNVVEAYVKGYRGGTLYGDEADHLKGLMKVGAIEPFEFMGLGVQDYDRPEWKKETEKKLEELDYDPKFPKRLQGEKEKDYQARVRRVIAEKENAITRFTSDPNMKSQPLERAKELLRSEMSSEGMERLKKIRPEDIEDDRMVRAWILVGVERLKKNPVYQQMSEDDQKKALKSYHSRMNNYRAEPANSQHEYIAPDVVDEDLLKKKIDEAIRSRRPNQ